MMNFSLVTKVLPVAATLCTAAFYAQDFTYNDVNYKVSGAGTVMVTGTDAFIEVLEIPETVPYNGSDYTVTAIDDAAFYYNQDLVSVHLPKTVTVIGNSAFEDCYSITSLNLPEQLVTLGNRALAGPSVSSFRIPATTQNIGRQVFINCLELRAITVDPQNTKFVAENGILFNKDRTTIVAFPAAKEMSSYTIPATVTKIAEAAFEGSKLEQISIPNGVTEVGEAAFGNSIYLSSITLPASVQKVGAFAFNSCLSLVHANLSESLQELGTAAFDNCVQLQKIEIPGSNTKFKTLSGVLFNGDMTTLITYPLGKPADQYEIPSGVKTLDNRAFTYNNKLRSITLPGSLQKLGTLTFAGMVNLEALKSAAAVPPTAKYSTFQEVRATIPITVPLGSKSAYMAADGWSGFSNYIEDSTLATGSDFVKITSVYPNPSHGRFTISQPEAGFKAEIYDLTGKLISTRTSANAVENIDLSNAGAGVYILKITGRSGKQTTTKIVVQ